MGVFSAITEIVPAALFTERPLQATVVGGSERPQRDRRVPVGERCFSYTRRLGQYSSVTQTTGIDLVTQIYWSSPVTQSQD